MTVAPAIAKPETRSTDVASIPELGHAEAIDLAHTEFARMIELLRRLRVDEWQQPTVCTLWKVQEMVAHVVGMADAQASLRQFAHDFRSAGRRSGGAMIDALNATQVRDRAELKAEQLVDRLRHVAPKTDGAP